MKRDRLEYALDILFSTNEQLAEIEEWCNSQDIKLHKYAGSQQLKLFFQPNQKNSISFFFIKFKNNIIWKNFADEELYE